MNRLWKVLITPWHVFDEIRGRVPIALPLWSILVVGLICQSIALIDFDRATISVITDSGVQEHVPYYFVFNVFGAVFLSVWGVIWALLLFSAWASYYWVVGKILRVDSDWRNWFGFTCWTAVPAVLGSLVGMVLFKLATTELGEIFRPYPFFWWFGMMVPNVFLVPIPLIWTFFIAVNGLRNWTGKNTVTCLLVVLIPVVALAVGPTNSIETLPLALFL